MKVLKITNADLTKFYSKPELKGKKLGCYEERRGILKWVTPFELQVHYNNESIEFEKIEMKKRPQIKDLKAAVKKVFTKYKDIQEIWFRADAAECSLNGTEKQDIRIY